MLDINLIREHPEAVEAGVRARNGDPEIVKAIVDLDARWRAVVSQVEDLRARRNRESKEIGKLKDNAERQARIAEMREVGERIGELESTESELREQLDAMMLEVPNLPVDSAPVGADEDANVVVRNEGGVPEFDFEPLPHWDLGPSLGIIDFERGARISGSRFYVLMGSGARLQRALINWMVDLHVTRHGYREAYPPYLVNSKCLVGTSQLPKFGDNLYHDAEEDLWLIPTAEVPLTNLHREEILDESDLPIYYTGYTACFRREKMSAGKDVRGIKRGHQFDKVEMVKYVTPEASEDELHSLLANAEDVCRLLELPYRIKELSTGDMSFPACHSYDVEVWAAGCQEWLEVSSCSNCSDFQARRADIRYRPSSGGGTRYVHTLNGSGLALPRTLIAVLENNQQADGSVTVPEVLRPYMGGAVAIEPH